MAIDQLETARATETGRRRMARVPRRQWVRLGVAVVIVVAVIVIAIQALNARDPRELRTIRVADLSFVSNVEVRQEGDRVAAYLPAGESAKSIVLLTDDPRESNRIRAFLEDLGTFEPGELRLQLNAMTMRIVIREE